jgi:hypothetical protein
MDLVYYTLGFDIKYLTLLHLSITSLRKHNKEIDILVICDESLIERCVEALKEFSNVNIVPCTDSVSAMDSSIKKLKIFDYDIVNYKKVLFIIS